MARRKIKTDSRQLDGILVLDKPEGPTSAACLNEIKRFCGQPKIGHAGTLDPMATGVLLVMLGQGTKLASYLTQERKTYCGQLKLGKITDSYDAQGKILEEHSWQHLSQQKIEQEMLDWQNYKEQIVPPVSAAKYKGQPLYALQRRGEEVPVKSKAITIFQVELILVQLPYITFRVTCSQGTYIRSLAHSLGQRLGCGAILTALRRECCHPFCLDQATSLETVLEAKDSLKQYVLPLAESLPHWPKKILNPGQEQAVRNGNWLNISQLTDLPTDIGSRAIFMDRSATPLALVEAKEKEGQVYWAILRGLWQ